MSHDTAADEVGSAIRNCFAALDQWFERPEWELCARPGYPGAWSAAEHLEHVSLVNHFLLLTIGKGCRKALKRAAHLPVPETPSDLSRLAAVADPDGFPWLPPEHMIPTGEKKLGAVRELLQRQGSQCRELLERMPAGEGRLCSIRMSVNDLGRLDMYQWLYFLAQHARYHLEFLRRRQDEG